MTSSAHAAQEAKPGSQVCYAQDHHRSTDGAAPGSTPACCAGTRGNDSGARRASSPRIGRAGAGDAGEVAAAQGRTDKSLSYIRPLNAERDR